MLAKSTVLREFDIGRFLWFRRASRALVYSFSQLPGTTRLYAAQGSSRFVMVRRLRLIRFSQLQGTEVCHESADFQPGGDRSRSPHPPRLRSVRPVCPLGGVLQALP